MNSLPTSCIILAATLLLIPSTSSASGSAPADRAAQLLASRGIVPVNAAGPYVEIGSYRIQAWTMLGRPYKVLADGTYFYRNFAVDDSAASGTLVVRFDHGRVSQLSLVSHAVETAMLAAPAGTKDQVVIASR
jgi:hypothetical protein